MVEMRRLSPADVAAMRALSAMFAAAFDEPDTYFKAPPGDPYLVRLLADPKFVALAAEEGGEVIGGLIAYELQKYEQERSELYIYDLAVRESARRRGVATALIERASSIAGDIGAHVLFVQADHSDDPAIALYTKLGRREDVLHFDIAAR